MGTLESITIALILTFIGAEIGRKFHYPRVIGQLTISLFLTIPLLKHFFVGDALVVIDVFSGLGAIFLLLLTGFELNIEELNRNKKEALLIAVLGAIIPFLFGFGLGHLLGLSITSSFIMGACMSVTAEGTKVALLIETEKLNTRIGSIMLGAGILDDVFEIILLSSILFLSNESTQEMPQISFLWKIVLFVGFILLARKFIPKIINSILKENSEIPLLGAMIIIGLVLALVSEFVGIGSLLGAFIAGVILQKSFFKEENREVESVNLRLFVFAFIIPFFFVNIGLGFDYHVFLDNPLLVGVVLGSAILGKILGTFATKPFVNLSWQQLHLIGWGMNSRGVMELVMAQIALSAGLISTSLYSAIVFMSITTTVLFPFMFKIILAKNPQIME